MKPVHQVLFAAGLLVLGTITWLILTRPKPQAGWLAVEAPARVAPGETITLRVTLNDPDETPQLNADLHGWTKRNRPLGSISPSRSRRVAASTPVTDFSLLVPDRPDVATVRAIIYLSPTGRWPDHIRVVSSDEIPVEASPGTASIRPLRPLRTHELAPAPAIPRLESALLRHLLVGLWLVVALALGLRLQRTRSHAPVATKPSLHASSLPLIGACLVTALAEFLRAELVIGDLARQLAIGRGVYDERLLPQQIAVLLTVVGLAALAVNIILRARQRRLVLGLLFYAAISLTAALSLHDADALLYSAILGLPIEQLAKLTAVSLSFWGLCSSPGAPAGSA